MKVKDKFSEYFEYLKKRGLTEKTIREHQRFIFGAISHAEVPDKPKRKLGLDKLFRKS